MAANNLHTRLTLDIYSLFFSDAVPKETGDGEQYWQDFFNISILEPALVATFNSIDLGSAYHSHVTSIFFEKNVAYFFATLKDSPGDVYLLNNLILILNAFVKNLKKVKDNQGRYYYDFSLLADAESKLLPNDQLLEKVLFNAVQKGGKEEAETDSSAVHPEQEQLMTRFFELLKASLNNKYLLKSSLNLMLNTTLVFHGTKFIQFFYKHDFINELFNKILLQEFSSNEVEKGTEATEPVLGLSAIDYNRLFIMLSILVNNSRYKSNEANLYKAYISDTLSDSRIFEKINETLYPLLSFNLILLDDARPDLAIQKSYKGSFFNIITFNKLNKLNYWYHDFLTDYLSDELQILLKTKKATIAEKIEQIKLETEGAQNGKNVEKLQRKKQNQEIKFIESLSLNLVLYAFIINSDAFNEYLTSHLNDLDVERLPELAADPAVFQNSTNLIDLFMSYSSFIFQNQHGNKINHLLSRLNLLVIFKLLSCDNQALQNNLLITTVNQFKYKLCHQIEPTINNFVRYQNLSSGSEGQDIGDDDLESSEYQVRIFYMIDVLQCFLRYNLTSNLDVISIKLSVDNVLWILDTLVINYDSAVAERAAQATGDVQEADNYNEEGNGEEEEGDDKFDYLFEYNWNELFVTMFRLLKFLNTDKTTARKNSSKRYFSLIEEVLFLVTFLLLNNEKLFKYESYLVELVYKLLEYKSTVMQLAAKLKAYQQSQKDSVARDSGADFSIYCKIILSVVYFMDLKLGLEDDKAAISTLLDFSQILNTESAPDNENETHSIRDNKINKNAFKEDKNDEGQQGKYISEDDALKENMKKLVLSQHHDFDYTQIAEILRHHIDELPTTPKTNTLVQQLFSSGVSNASSSSGSKTESGSLSLKAAESLVAQAQFPDTLKYVQKKKLIFNNYKISLVDEAIDVMVGEFDQMFR